MRKQRFIRGLVLQDSGRVEIQPRGYSHIIIHMHVVVVLFEG